MKLISDNIILENKKELVLTHLYLKGKQYKIDISEGIRGVIYNIYAYGNIESKKDFDEVAKICVKDTSIKTLKSFRNTLSKCVMMGILKNSGKYIKIINDKWLPVIDHNDNIGLEYKIISKDAI